MDEIPGQAPPTHALSVLPANDHYEATHASEHKDAS